MCHGISGNLAAHKTSKEYWLREGQNMPEIIIKKQLKKLLI